MKPPPPKYYTPQPIARALLELHRPRRITEEEANERLKNPSIMTKERVAYMREAQAYAKRKGWRDEPNQ